MILFDLIPDSFPADVRARHASPSGVSQERAPQRMYNLSRRNFLKLSGAAAGSVFVLGVFSGCAPGESGALEPQKVPASGSMGEAQFQANAWIAVNEAGDVFIMNPRSEMGQGIKTAVGQVMADEMDADWSRVHILQADGHPKYGNQNTGGSNSLRSFFTDYRTAGATARAMLIGAAAQQWGVDAAECDTDLHEVVHGPTGNRLGFGELAAAAAGMPVPEDPTLKPRERWRYIGKGFRAVDSEDILTGKAIYGADVRVPGMKYSVIARPPVLGGDVKSLDDTAARAVPGVLDVIRIPRYENAPGFNPVGGVAVVAENTWAAIQGRNALQIEWEDGPNAVYDSDAYAQQLIESASNPGNVVREEGDIDAAFADAAQVVEATYSTPMMEHGMMAPPAATAWLKDDGTAEVWTATQSPQGARNEVANALGLEPDDVILHMTLLGGAFGRKGKADFTVEAAMVAQRFGGPVQVFWTREDAMRHGYYHAPSGQVLRGALDADGHVTGWHHRSAYPAISSTFNPAVIHAEGEMNLGARSILWDVPNMRIENCAAPAHIRIGWFRAVTNIHHAYAVNAFIGELAQAAGRDQLEMFLDILGPDRELTELFPDGRGPYGEPAETHMITSGRMRGVIERAAAEAGWGKDLPEGHGMGLAANYSFMSYAAFAVHASVEGSTVKVHRVDAALDCGTAVNPDRVISQMEGAVVMGLTCALYSDIKVRNGAVETGNFDTYKLVGLAESPEVHIHLIESTERPGGVGEPGMPPMMPALTNAILDATGTPVRTLPVNLA